MEYYEHELYEWFEEVRAPLTDWHFSSDYSQDEFFSYPEWERNIFHIGNLISMCMNGGMDAYLRSGFGGNLNNCIFFLKEIGADASSQELEVIRNLFADGIPESYEDRDTEINIICKNNGVERVDQIYQISLNENILTKIKIYYDSNAP